MIDIADQLTDWVASGSDFAVATVVAATGSAPRPVGAALAVDSDGVSSVPSPAAAWRARCTNGAGRGAVAWAGLRCDQGRWNVRRVTPRLPVPASAFTGYRFAPEVIVLAVRWYLRFNLSYRDLEELLAERGVTADHVTLYRSVTRFTPLPVSAARFTRHALGDRWFVDETHVKVARKWTCLYRTVDQFGQVIDVMASRKRDLAAARRFFVRALRQGRPAQVTTDREPAYPRVLDELLPQIQHVDARYANNRVEADHGRLKARLRPMRGLTRSNPSRPSALGTRSCRTSDADTTTWPPKPKDTYRLPLRSQRSRRPSDGPRLDHATLTLASTQQRPPLTHLSGHDRGRNCRTRPLACRASDLEGVARGLVDGGW